MGCTQRLIRTVFLPRFSRLFCLLSSRILQINFLYLYVVTIRRYKLSFFAKPPTKSLPHFSVFKNSWREANNPPGAGTSQIYLCACAPMCCLVRQIWRQQEVTQSFDNFYGQRSCSSYTYKTGRQFMSLAAYAERD